MCRIAPFADSVKVTLSIQGTHSLYAEGVVYYIEKVRKNKTEKVTVQLWNEL